MPLSSFWTAISKISPLGHISVTYEPSSQSNLEFWNTIWQDNCTLSTKFPKLYEISSNKHISISDVLLTQGLSLHFNRSLTGILAVEWHQLLYIISTSSFTHSNDKIAWRWKHSGNFTVRSIYKILNFTGINDNKYAIIWTLPLPPKIRIFIWLLLNNRILTKNNLRKRGCNGDIQ